MRITSVSSRMARFVVWLVVPRRAARRFENSTGADRHDRGYSQVALTVWALV
jgi:hypothetical protein